MSFSQIQSVLKPGLERVNALIDQSLESDISLLDSTNKALREHPGKMMRPMLSLLAAGAAGKPVEASYRYAAASELLHNATLLHDDVVDGAGERRGIPTVFSLLGGGPAVLLGDYWLVKCLQLILSAGPGSQRVLDLFSRTLGHLTEAELLQMQKASTGDTTEEDYLRIIFGKTASLFQLSALSGALSVGAEEPVVQALGEFARGVGIAFQIKDDILDYAPASAALGKPVGIDLKEQKITQPLLSALEQVPASEALEIRSLVASAADHPEHVQTVRAFVEKHSGVALAEERMDFYLKNAISCLEILPESEEKSYLAKLALFVGQRTW